VLKRFLSSNIQAALADTPVVLVVGARQTGKSTLVLEIAREDSRRYTTLDDATTLSAAKADPEGFIAGLDGPVVIDEIQRAPELLLAMKRVVDRERAPGRFLLTGSANVLLLPKVADSLAGRMEVLTLWPLSQGEIAGNNHSLVDALLAAKPRWKPSENSAADIFSKVQRGGYPEIFRRGPGRRGAWFNSYMTTILQRDVRDLANVAGLTEMPRLLRLLAHRTSALLNFADLSRDLGIPQTTFKRYMTLLEMTYLVGLLPYWSPGATSRFVKSPKIHMVDCGFAAHLAGVRPPGHGEGLPGNLVETFVYGELQRQASWATNSVQIYHYRTHTGAEVDFVLEAGDGTLVGIEVKAAMAVTGSDLRGLRNLAEHAGKRFLRGVVLYGGREVVSFGDGLQALPLSCLWM
jgi:predicted AAA+ superfamily ATPase